MKDEARILLSERLKDIRQGRNPELRQIKPKRFKDMVTEFLEKHARQRRDYQSFVHNTDILLRHFEGCTLQDITPAKIQEFVTARLGERVRAARSRKMVRPATVNRQRATLSTIFNCAKAWGYYGGDNPVGQVKRFRESLGRDRFLTAEEASKIIEHAPRHLRPVITAALHTGGRRREVLRLRWDDVDLDRGVLYFDPTNTKSGKQREVPIDRQLMTVLRERSKVRAIGGDARTYLFTWRGKRMTRIRTAFEKARKRAGLGENVTFHTLRHTFASWYMINGGDLYRLQKYLGHSTIALTQRYAHLSREHLQSGVQFFGAPAADRSHQVDTNAASVGSSAPVSSV